MTRNYAIIVGVADKSAQLHTSQVAMCPLCFKFQDLQQNTQPRLVSCQSAQHDANGLNAKNINSFGWSIR